MYFTMMDLIEQLLLNIGSEINHLKKYSIYLIFETSYTITYISN